MNLLIDANLSPRLVPLLQAGGVECSHVADHGLLRASDDEILRFAVERSWTILSADSDFTTMVALSGARTPSLILLRSSDLLDANVQARLLLASLPRVVDDLESGCVVSLSPTRLRVRPLPLREPRVR